MKCPECDSHLTTHYDLRGGLDHEEYHCDICGAAWEFHHLIDTAELLDLIEEARLTGKFETYGEFIDAIKSYLSGDHAPLERLAGVE